MLLPRFQQILKYRIFCYSLRVSKYSSNFANFIYFLLNIWMVCFILGPIIVFRIGWSVNKLECDYIYVYLRSAN
ncbi:hypothetical protein HanRHA438_Chr16g0757531 [Helianthus annuus]|nr:hypothetical protein HanRHA438_Chr16g0757531 [Helianthus annuus]